MFLGFILAISKFYFSGQRSGLFGSEINFTGYLILIFIYVINSTDKIRFLDCVIWISFIFITGSRAFLILSILGISYYALRDRRMLTNFITLVFVMFYVSFDSLINTLDTIPFFRPTGYIDDFSRLYQLYDSSSITRFNIVEDYIIHFKNDIINFLLGNSKTQLESNLMESHNSFFQKTFEYGLLSTVLVVNLMRIKLENWIFNVLFIYGFFLHNLFSLPVLIFILIYGKKSNDYYTNI